jgi:hypothetical protein
VAKVSEAAAALGRRRWAGTTKEERSAEMSALRTKAWAAMTPEERQAEMSRRRRLGLKRKKKAKALS